MTDPAPRPQQQDVRCWWTRLLLLMLLCALGAGFRPAPAQPSITGLSPERGAPGTTVRIDGTNIDPSVSTTTVRIGGTEAPLDSVTSTAIYARVPSGPIGPSRVTVETGGSDPLRITGRFTVLARGRGNMFSRVDSLNLTGVRFGTTAWGDYDDDGDLDLVVTGTDSTGTEIGTIYRNDGDGSFTPLPNTVKGLDSGSADWGDYDGDGDLDLLLTGTHDGENTLLYRNDGNDTFSLVDAGLTDVDFSSADWGDFNDDGRLDVVVSGYSSSDFDTSIYQNVGDTDGDGETDFQKLGADITNVVASSDALQWQDYNGDGRLDLLVVGRNNDGSLVAELYRNEGGGQFTPVDAGLSAGLSADWGDYDNDGDSDLVIVGEGPSHLYRNDDGTFTPIDASLPSGPLGFVEWADQDGDGDLDLLIAGKTDTSRTSATLLRNDGADTFTRITPRISGITDGSVDWADYDGDGDLDLLLTGRTAYGTADHTTRLYANAETAYLAGTALAPADTALPDMRVQAIGADTTVTATTRADGSFDAIVPPSTYSVVAHAVRDTAVFSHGPTQTTLSLAEADTASVPLDATTGQHLGLRNVSVNGADANVLVSPDDSLTLRFDYSAWSDSGRPSDSLFAVVGIDGQAATYAALGTPGPHPGTDGTVAVRLQAPSTAAPYTLYTRLVSAPSRQNLLDTYANGFPDPYRYIPTATLRVQTPPPAPSSLQATGHERNVNLRWTGAATDDVAGYLIYRDTTAFGPSATPADRTPYDTTAAGDTTLVDLGVARAPTYRYRVTTVDTAGLESGFSAEVSARVQPRLHAADASPDHAVPSSPVRLSGAEFQPGRTTVHVGGEPAPVTSVQDNTLAVEFPSGVVGPAPITVTTDSTVTATRRVTGLVRGKGGHLSPTGLSLSKGYPDYDHDGNFDAVWGDYDRDGDMDLAVAGTGKIYENQGDGSFASKGLNLSDGVVQSVDWGDYDGDGDLDLLVTDNSSTEIYENKNGNFQDIGKDFAPSSLTTPGKMSTWGDYDGDGDLDFIVTRTGTVYRNDGNNTFTPALKFPELGFAKWADYDRDGDMDLLLAGSTGSNYVTIIARNDGGGSFTAIDTNVVGVFVGSADWGDYDRDGDLDLVMTGCRGYPRLGTCTTYETTRIYRNDGNDSFVEVADKLGVFDGSSADWGDYDGDGDLDLVVAGYNDEKGKKTARVYRNEGNDSFVRAQAGLDGIRRGASEWVDYDGDGDLDLFVGGAVYENGGTTDVPPRAPDALRADADTGRIALRWTPPSPSDLRQFHVYRSTSPLDTTHAVFDSVAVGDSTYVDSTVRTDSTYHYRVTAVDSARNESTLSPSAIAEVPVVSSSKTVDSENKVSFGPTGASVQVSGLSTPGTIDVDRLRGRPDSTTGIDLDNVSNVRYRITRESLSFTNATLRFEVSQIGGIDDPENVFIYTREQRGDSFTRLSTDYDADTGTLKADVSDFSRFVFASNTEPLPVELARFEATANGGKAHLTWTTASETGNAGFVVERRGGTPEWSPVGRVDGAGTTTQAQRYRFVDASLPYEADSLSYRLRQVDTDGSRHYSSAVTLRRGVSTVQLLGTAPNPADRRVKIRYALPAPQTVTIRLYDVLGRRVRTVVQSKKDGRHEHTLDVSTLASGVYFLRLRADGTTRTQKLTVTR